MSTTCVVFVALAFISFASAQSFTLSVKEGIISPSYAINIPPYMMAAISPDNDCYNLYGKMGAPPNETSYDYEFTIKNNNVLSPYNSIFPTDTNRTLFISTLGKPNVATSSYCFSYFSYGTSVAYYLKSYSSQVLRSAPFDETTEFSFPYDYIPGNFIFFNWTVPFGSTFSVYKKSWVKMNYTPPDLSYGVQTLYVGKGDAWDSTRRTKSQNSMFIAEDATGGKFYGVMAFYTPSNCIDHFTISPVLNIPSINPAKRLQILITTFNGQSKFSLLVKAKTNTRFTVSSQAYAISTYGKISNSDVSSKNYDSSWYTKSGDMVLVFIPQGSVDATWYFTMNCSGYGSPIVEIVTDITVTVETTPPSPYYPIYSPPTQVYYCNGVLSSDSQVCSSNGQCQSTDKCVCKQGTNGKWCEVNLLKIAMISFGINLGTILGINLLVLSIGIIIMKIISIKKT
jgi:hypothetical protein